MSLLDHLNQNLREQLLRYIGSSSNEKLKERLAEDVMKILDEAVSKLGSTWDEGGPQPGDVVEVRESTGVVLEPDDMSIPLYDANSGYLSFTFMLPGAPLLVLAT